jgi:membrane associated rhomboid family serine protease
VVFSAIMSRAYAEGGGGSSLGIGGAITPAVKGLVIANASVFLLEYVLHAMGLDAVFVNLFALQPSLVYRDFYLWQLVTYLFLHGDLGHILVNMFMLWMFGAEMERIWGTRRFLKYYFLTGVGAGIVTCFFSAGSRTIGASGAIFGVMLAYGMTFPNRQILFWFVFPMKAKHFVLLMAGIELLASANWVSDGIGHFAHLGGMLFGYVYLKRAWRLKAWIAELRWKARRRRFEVFDGEEERKKYPYH